MAAAVGSGAALVEWSPGVPFVEETGNLVSLFMWLPFGIITVVPALFGTSADKGRLCVTPPDVHPAAAGGTRHDGRLADCGLGRYRRSAGKLCLASFGTLSRARRPA